MTSDLPTLKIGCGILFGLNGKLEAQCGVKNALCYDCASKKNVILAHAAAHHEKVENYEIRSQLTVSEFLEARGARDAVLALAGLTTKDLEVR